MSNPPAVLKVLTWVSRTWGVRGYWMGGIGSLTAKSRAKVGSSKSCPDEDLKICRDWQIWKSVTWPWAARCKPVRTRRLRRKFWKAELKEMPEASLYHWDIPSHLPLPMPLLEDVGVWSRPTRSPVIKWNRNLLYQKHCDSRWYFWLNICQACLSPDRQHGCVWEAFLSPWVYYEPNRNHYNQRARKFEKQYFYIFQGMYIFVASSWCASMQIIYD